MYPPPGFFMPMPPLPNGQPYPPMGFFPNPQGGGFYPYPMPYPFMMPPPKPPANEGEIGIFEVNSNGSIDADPLINFYKGSAQANVEAWNLA